MSRLYHRRRQLVALLLAWCACASAIDGLVSAAAAAASEERVRNPWFCHDYDCPGYTVLRTLDDLELRSYSQGIWVSTNTSGGFDAAVRLGFLVRLRAPCAPRRSRGVGDWPQKRASDDSPPPSVRCQQGSRRLN